MYSLEEIVSSYFDAIEISANNKRNHRGDILLVEVVPDMYTPTTDDWAKFQIWLISKVEALNFPEVYVLGFGDNRDICLKIK